MIELGNDMKLYNVKYKVKLQINLDFNRARQYYL